MGINSDIGPNTIHCSLWWRRYTHTNPGTCGHSYTYYSCSCYSSHGYTYHSCSCYSSHRCSNPDDYSSTNSNAHAGPRRFSSGRRWKYTSFCQ